MLKIMFQYLKRKEKEIVTATVSVLSSWVGSRFFQGQQKKIVSPLNSFLSGQESFCGLRNIDTYTKIGFKLNSTLSRMN